MTSYATLSKTGGRKVNEDAVGVRQKGGSIFCVLADGLGGHNAGEVASALVVETSLRIFDEGNIPFDELLATCMNESQNAIIEEQHRTNRIDEMKTTAVMLIIENNKAQWAHVGDSRLYRFENNAVAERTLDHSVPQMLVLQGEIKEEDIRHHEDRNRLIRAMGMEWDTQKFILSKPLDLPASSSFLLSSDGFWELIEDEEMIDCAANCKNPEKWLTKMEKIILKNGDKSKMDNYSAIGVFV